MLHFYDGQIRRYIGQTIRALSNFTVKYADGSLVRIPVMYGDADKQVASILRNNSENKINSTPRIAVYVSALSMDRARLADATYVGKVHIREREYDAVNDVYGQAQGKNYTVERLMPTPFTLTLKADIWASNTDQKLQILEQLLVLFNPSLELQTSDNYIDWTSLTVLELKDLTWSSRAVPQGTGDAIDIATMTLETPIFLSPPVKVKHLGVITNIITSIFDGADTSWMGVDGLGTDLSGGSPTMSGMLTRDYVTISDFGIQVYNDSNMVGQAVLLNAHEGVNPHGVTLEVPIRGGTAVNWSELFGKYPGQFVDGSSRVFLVQADGTEVSGVAAVNALDPTILQINWDPATYPTDTDIDAYNGYTSQRTSKGTFDAIIDPTKVYPDHGMINPVAGDRFLIIEDIADTGEHDWGTEAWGTFTASANDIIEYDGTNWHIIFEAAQEADSLIYQTNIYKSTADRRIQFMWNGVEWGKSFEGEYKAGTWRLEL